MEATRYTVKWKLQPDGAAHQSDRYNSTLGALALAGVVLAQAPADIWIEATDGRRVVERRAIVSRWRAWRRAIRDRAGQATLADTEPMPSNAVSTRSPRANGNWRVNDPVIT